MKKLAMAVVVLAVLLQGCASSQKISSSDTHNLDSVQINTSVQKPDEMYYMGPGAGVGLMFGVVGALAADAANDSPEKALRAFAESNGVVIEKIVVEELSKALANTGKLTLTENNESKTATVNIVISQYGFSVKNSFGSEMAPLVGFKCTMLDSTGKEIWSANDYVTTLGNPASPVTLEEIKNNPKLIEESWRVVSKAVAEKIAKTL